MYAFTDELEQAWQQLFEHFSRLLDSNGDPEISLRFDSDQSLLRDPALLFGHTCGYPLMTRLKNRVSPFCVPVFDVPGTDGKRYSSQFIVGARSGIASLEECRGRVAAMNAPDSNSGMNVFRYAISRLHSRGPFFSGVITTGGHLHSLEAVANQQADIAAIDCVSYQLIADHWPDLAKRVRSIGLSIKTCGLPLVAPNLHCKDAATWTARLNQALAQVSESARRRLHLAGFEPAVLADYEEIVDLENRAIETGYPLLA